MDIISKSKKLLYSNILHGGNRSFSISKKFTKSQSISKSKEALHYGTGDANTYYKRADWCIMKTSILLEIILHRESDSVALHDFVRSWAIDGFELDEEYEPIPMDGGGGTANTAILHGWVENTAALKILEDHSLVVHVWKDTVVEPMPSSDI